MMLLLDSKCADFRLRPRCVAGGGALNWNFAFQFSTEVDAMFSDELLARFAESFPVPVMMRGILENILAPARLNAIFEEAAELQYTRELLFSTVVEMMSRVVARTDPSLNAAYRRCAEEAGVSAKCVYNKVNGMEPGVSDTLVRRTARELELVIRALGGVLPPLVPGYHARVLDGNHFAATDRRLRLLRNGPSPLPGWVLAILDPALGLITDVIPCEDGHAQERSLLDKVLELVEANDVWLMDRNFCVLWFLLGIHRKNAAFLVRQHANNVPWKPCGERIDRGVTSRGHVWEQAVTVGEPNAELQLRRVTIELFTPTRDGESELHLLTNLPATVLDALAATDMYLQRWLIETAFRDLTIPLRCEIEGLGMPRAAIFTFALAVVCYNALQTLNAALATAQPPVEQTVAAPQPNRQSPTTPRPELRREISTYYVADEIAGTWRALDMIPDDTWQSQFATLSPSNLALKLQRLALDVDLTKFRKRPASKRGGQRNAPSKPGSHVSTAKVLMHGQSP